MTPGADRVPAAASHTLSRSMSRVRTTLRRVPAPLALLLAVAAVLSLSWNLATAPLQGPDESDHVGYIEHLAETGKIPSAAAGNGAYATDEVGALEAGYLRMYQNRLARPPWTADAERRFRSFEDSLPDSARDNGNGPNSVGKNPPLYYVYEAMGWKLAFGAGFFGKLFVARLLGGLMLLAMVAFTWLAAGEVFARRRLPQTVAAGVVALLPMAGFLSGIVNTDIMLAAIWTAFLWLALRTARLGLSWQRAAGLSAVTVLSVLTHGRGLALVPALLIALLVAWLTHERTLRSTLRAAASSGVVLLAGLGIYKVLDRGQRQRCAVRRRGEHRQPLGVQHPPAALRDLAVLLPAPGLDGAAHRTARVRLPPVLRAAVLRRRLLVVRGLLPLHRSMTPCRCRSSSC